MEIEFHFSQELYDFPPQNSATEQRNDRTVYKALFLESNLDSLENHSISFIVHRGAYQ